MSDCIIVDEQDNPIGFKERTTIVHEDIHRVASLWLTDTSTGDCLITQRQLTKAYDPGKWQTAVAGTVEKGETYEDNIRKETLEEIGLSGIVFTPGPKQYIDGGRRRFFDQWFYARVDKRAIQLVLQEEEVVAARWIPVQELVDDCTKNPDKYAPLTRESLELLGVGK